MSETIQSIMEWQSQVFPDSTLMGQLLKFKEEKAEWEESKCKDISELADMFIVACGVSRFDAYEGMYCFSRVTNELYHSPFPTIELQKAVDKKMAINRARKWEKLDGLYKHKA